MGAWINTAGMNIDELVKKQTEIRKKLGSAMSLGMSPAVINQLQSMIDDISIAITETQYAKPNSDPDENFDDYLNIG